MAGFTEQEMAENRKAWWDALTTLTDEDLKLFYLALQMSRAYLLKLPVMDVRLAEMFNGRIKGDLASLCEIVASQIETRDRAAGGGDSPPVH